MVVTVKNPPIIQPNTEVIITLTAAEAQGLKTELKELNDELNIEDNFTELDRLMTMIQERITW